jgi:NAD(P)-dependent dehydrogenase (short-subunit alcohol dehydrogenase family)
MTLEGRVALVTGSGGSGMGRSIALTLARDGADIALNYDRRGEQADATRAAIEAMGRRVTVCQADIADAASVASMVREAESALGPLDVVVGNAGAPWKPQDVTEITPEHLRRVLGAEIESVYHLLRSALPGMRSRGYGRFVLIGGHMADDWRYGPPDAPLDYPLGKASRHWLVRTLAPMERLHGVTLNAVAPGPTRRFSHEEALAALEHGPPPGNENTPAHIAEVVSWLCSDAASRITGAVIPVPGHKPV